MSLPHTYIHSLVMQIPGSEGAEIMCHRLTNRQKNQIVITQELMIKHGGQVFSFSNNPKINLLSNELVK